MRTGLEVEFRAVVPRPQATKCNNCVTIRRRADWLMGNACPWVDIRPETRANSTAVARTDDFPQATTATRRRLRGRDRIASRVGNRTSDWGGLTEHEARSRARRNFGNVTRARERFHERQHFVWPGQLAQDLRYAWRGLWYSRAFLATTVLTLAVGMSLVSVVFGVFNATCFVRSPCTILTASTQWVGDRRRRGAPASACRTTRTCRAGATSSTESSRRRRGASSRTTVPSPSDSCRATISRCSAFACVSAAASRRLTQPFRGAKQSRF